MTGNRKKLMSGRRRYLWMIPGFLLLLLFWFSLPDPLFQDPTSTVILDREMSLLGAKISADQQWRFPECDSVPEKFMKCLICFEDKYFRYHPGFNPVALGRAVYLNARRGKVVSGGSTITMQVIRLARKNRNRTYFEKALEIFKALRLELTHSKRDILRLYASHAPFGGNVVGLDAAAWRYFGRNARQLSWAESATLAVLPNSPGLIYPGRNPRHLLIKRNKLLDQLLRKGIIDTLTRDLAISERLTDKPFPLPQLAPHLLSRVAKEGHQGARVRTTIDYTLQERVNNILMQHSIQLRANEIWNAAVIVVEVNTGNVVAYAGNLPASGQPGKGNDVDIIRSPRSTGSILKPFLYASMLKEGLLLPNTLVPDIPMQIGGFIPENYSLTYDGAVPAKRALARSLNIPAVKMLQQYGYDQFYSLLRKTGITTLNKPADHYGLALILGGAEAHLWDLSGIYASLARRLNHFNGKSTGYSTNDFHPPSYLFTEPVGESALNDQPQFYDAASIWLTFEAMIEVTRPDAELQWQRFSSSRKIAWKTGTSFGNRDAWSVGVTPGYVVGVWVGNATGEGRPGLTGIGVAAPILFDIFQSLPASAWFRTPYEEMAEIPVCRYSGYRASSICEPLDTVWVQRAGLKTATCPFHQMIHLDKTGTFQVNSGCESPDNMKHVSWFILPPVQEWYFRNRNPFYSVLPPFKPGCQPGNVRKSMEMIYPKNNSSIYIPVDLGGKPGSAVFKVAHRNPAQMIYWHLDDRFLGTTTTIHQLALSPGRGNHKLTLIDQNGETLFIKFEILTKTD